MSTPPSAPEDSEEGGRLSTREARSRPALIVNTGEGKGKTTAALGVALRAWQQGWSIGVFQFIKSGRWVTGERAALAALDAEHHRSGAGGPIEFLSTGTGRSGLRRPKDSPDPADAARAAWAEIARRLAEQRHQLYVLDEFTYPVTRGWVPLPDVLNTLRDRPGVQHVIITGRNAPPELIDLATTVTVMDKAKHPFDSGQRGQAGIEW